MVAITVYRENRQLRGTELAANTLASFLVAQGQVSLPALSETRVMNRDLLLFVNRKPAMDYWCDQGRMQACGGGYVLTAEGLDVILNREANEARTSSGKRNAFNVSPGRVRLARRFILTGRWEEPLEIEVLDSWFELDIPDGNWAVA